MEEQICQNSKFGFCKYKKECKRKHFSEECKDLAMCKNMKMCMKRHPKGCKRYSEGQCRFERGCAYKHQDEAINKEQVNLHDKVLELEKVVKVITEKHVSLNEKAMEQEKVLRAMTRKVLSLENEINEMKTKQNIQASEAVRGPFLFHSTPKKECEEKEKSNLDFTIKEKLVDHKVNENGSKQRKEKKSIDTKSDTKDNMFKCTRCNYETKKEATLKKHFITKHEDHVCKECEEKLPSFMELMKHVSKHHHKEMNGEKDEIEEENKEEQGEANKDNKSVFVESGPDKFEK